MLIAIALISSQLLLLALGYWIITVAYREADWLKSLGTIIGWFLIIASLVLVGTSIYSGIKINKKFEKMEHSGGCPMMHGGMMGGGCMMGTNGKCNMNQHGQPATGPASSGNVSQTCSCPKCECPNSDEDMSNKKSEASTPIGIGSESTSGRRLANNMKGRNFDVYFIDTVLPHYQSIVDFSSVSVNNVKDSELKQELKDDLQQNKDTIKKLTSWRDQLTAQ